MKTPFVVDVQQKATLKMQSVTDWWDPKNVTNISYKKGILKVGNTSQCQVAFVKKILKWFDHRLIGKQIFSLFFRVYDSQ